MNSTRRFGEFYRNISEDIYKFCEALRFTPTWQQRQLLDAIMAAKTGRGPRRIATRSGQGPGKTKSSVVGGLWCTLRDVDALTIVTAPTMRQCRDVWMVEARRTLEGADPMLKKIINVTKTKIEVMGRPDWGVKLVTATREENAQGYHQANMTVIGEEASGIPRDIITQFKGTLSNPDSLFILIGNPNTLDCAFHDCFSTQRSGWLNLHWNAEDTAKDYPWILDPQRNKDLEEEFGRDSDVYRIRVLGEFPLSDPNCVLSVRELEEVAGPEHMLAASRMERADDAGKGFARQFGIDLARYGGDESTIFQRSGNAIVDWAHFAHREPAEVIRASFGMQRKASWTDRDTTYVCDAGGMGQGSMHVFYEAGKSVVEFSNGGRAMDSEMYENRITEAWFRFANKHVRPRRCMIPADPLTIKQLATRRYFTTRKGKLVLETKDEYAKRGYDSPDRADGIVYAFDDHVEAVGHVATRTIEGERQEARAWE